jgi:hypothetical protein
MLCDLMEQKRKSADPVILNPLLIQGGATSPPPSKRKEGSRKR